MSRAGKYHRHTQRVERDRIIARHGSKCDHCGHEMNMGGNDGWSPAVKTVNDSVLVVHRRCYRAAGS